MTIDTKDDYRLIVSLLIVIDEDDGRCL